MPARLAAEEKLPMQGSCGQHATKQTLRIRERLRLKNMGLDSLVSVACPKE
jgi:hypothetical protein